MNINSMIFVPQGVSPIPVRPMSHLLAFMPQPSSTQNFRLLQQIQTQHHLQHHLIWNHHHTRQQQQQQRVQRQQSRHRQQQKQEQQQQHMLLQQQKHLAEQQHQAAQKQHMQNSHRIQEIQQIHQQQRFQQAKQQRAPSKTMKARFMRPINFEEWSNISQMHMHQQLQQLEQAKTIKFVRGPLKPFPFFSNEAAYQAFVDSQQERYRFAEEQLQNEHKLQFQKYFQHQPTNGIKRQPMMIKFDNKKLKIQQCMTHRGVHARKEGIRTLIIVYDNELMGQQSFLAWCNISARGCVKVTASRASE